MGISPFPTNFLGKLNADTRIDMVGSDKVTPITRNALIDFNDKLMDKMKDLKLMSRNHVDASIV